MERAHYIQERSLPELKDFIEKKIFTKVSLDPQCSFSAAHEAHSTGLEQDGMSITETGVYADIKFDILSNKGSQRYGDCYRLR